ncbi:hypothetical protein QBC34DRAFT_306562 [Podospora aff. communis PSN243]|uniref:NACHT domain-containing protein n=1 Tax=Podospora aff. communis PSN243 TaxID=3040156 RepID=A0AAV9GBY6_9PEZI|nr:hypothetical protein QBC34DRAFT_306562 [Podospora aff. communis PSN243]
MAESHHDGPGRQVSVSARGNTQTGSGLQLNGYIAQLNINNGSASKAAQYLRDLYITDPRCDKQRLENANGTIVSAACEWVLGQAEYRTWRDDADSSLLWVKGGPGTGKTALLRWIIDHLQHEDQSVSAEKEGGIFAYFFCEQGNKATNNASAVLRGLCYMLITRSKTPDETLLEVVGEVCDATGAKAFDGPGAWFMLEKIFRRILQHLISSREGHTVYLVVDALDACGESLQNLLKLAVDTTDSPAIPHVKWLLTSHRVSNISRILNIDGTATRHSLDVDDDIERLSTSVEAFADHCARKLADSIIPGKYSVDEEVRKQLRQQLSGKGYSFLYTALLAADAQRARNHEELREILEKAAQDVVGLYEQAFNRIHHLEDDLRRKCLYMLGAIATAYRPMAYPELRELASAELEIDSRVMWECGTFFAISNNRDVQIISQSARDFLHNTPLTPSPEKQHYQLFAQSVKVMEKHLHRDICQLAHPGYATIDVDQDHQQMLGSLTYACRYWIDHLIASEVSLKPKDVEVLHEFLKAKFLKWVEHNAPNAETLIDFATDAQRFLDFNAETMIAYPLQVYASALLFSPTNTLMKELFAEEEPGWVSIGSGMERSHWSPWIRTLNCMTGMTDGVVIAKPACFSSDGKWIAALIEKRDGLSPSPYAGVAIWDLQTGAWLWTLPTATDCVGFPRQTSKIAVTIGRNMDFWDLKQGCWDIGKRINGLSPVRSAFSPQGTWLAAVAGGSGSEVEMWDWERQDCVLTFGRTGNSVSSITSLSFSANGFWLATADSTGVCVWNHESGDCLWTIDTTATAVGFSKSPEDFVLLARYDMLTTWNWQQKKQVRKLIVEKSRALRDAWSPMGLSADGSRFAVARTSTTKVWDVATRRRLQTLSGYGGVRTVSFSPDGSQLALGDNWGLKICSTTSSNLLESHEDKCHRGRIKWIKMSADRNMVASISVDAVIVWDARTGRQLSKIEPKAEEEDDNLLDACFSNDGSCVILVYRHHDPMVWDVELGRMTHSISQPAVSARLSPDGARVALVTVDGSIKVWNLVSRQFDRDDLFNMKFGSGNRAGLVAFAPTSVHIAVSSDTEGQEVEDSEVSLWELNGRRWKKGKVMSDTGTVVSLCFSSDGELLMGSADGGLSIWEVSSGDLVRRIGRIMAGIDVLEFDATTSNILTNYGLVIVHEEGADIDEEGLVAIRSRYDHSREGFGLNDDMTWITWGSHPVLWLPPDYRPNSVAVVPAERGQRTGASLIALGCRSGRVVFLRFPGKEPPLVSS